MRKVFKYLDKPLLITTIILFLIGLIMVFSASNVTAYMSYVVSPYYYFVKQAAFLIAGFLVFLFMINMNTKTYGVLSRGLLLILMASLGVLLVIGTAKNRAVSWFDLGIISFQPSEFAKIVTIVYLAYFYDKNKNKLKSWGKSLSPIGICIGVAALIFMQPDLGTTIIYALLVAAIFVIVPIAPEIKYKTVFAGIGIIGFGLISIFGAGKGVLRERQMERFDFKRPCDRILENGNQVCNCYIAMNNGGLTGVGLGNSTQKYLYLPEPYTDFIFAIIVEELGVITGILIILLYMFVLYRILLIGRRSYTNMGAIMCYGVAVYIFLHIAVNLLGIMGMMPMTGVPLPFMSYGGSFTICLIAALTIVQRVSVENGRTRDRELKGK
ncbi:MAG: FtsW/RodA/SpoVE family cell cycle protein [Bacilli bacterium]|nr:FtsW/RodA/SpoVE family cell cycle protein [Bacilli bacterium]